MVLRCVVLEDVQRELGGARVRVVGVMRAEEAVGAEEVVGVVVVVGAGEVDAVVVVVDAVEEEDPDAICRTYVCICSVVLPRRPRLCYLVLRLVTRRMITTTSRIFPVDKTKAPCK